jgi:hypothetical protein
MKKKLTKIKYKNRIKISYFLSPLACTWNKIFGATRRDKRRTFLVFIFHSTASVLYYKHMEQHVPHSSKQFFARFISLTILTL